MHMADGTAIWYSQAWNTFNLNVNCYVVYACSAQVLSMKKVSGTGKSACHSVPELLTEQLVTPLEQAPHRLCYDGALLTSAHSVA
jgi:hypothetical protein